MPSFDVVSEVDLQEVRNAIENASREILQRYDFKGSKSNFNFKEKESLIELVTEDNMRLKACNDILMQKLSKRGVSLKLIEFGAGEKAGGDMLRQEIKIKQGLESEELKKMNKFIKSQKFKVSSQAQGDQLRVTGKKRDLLQEVISALKGEFSALELQFTNFRE